MHLSEFLLKLTAGFGLQNIFIMYVATYSTQCKMHLTLKVHKHEIFYGSILNNFFPFFIVIYA